MMVTPASPCPVVLVTRPEAVELVPPSDTVCVSPFIVITPTRELAEVLASTEYVTFLGFFPVLVTLVMCIHGTLTRGVQSQSVRLSQTYTEADPPLDWKHFLVQLWVPSESHERPAEFSQVG